MSVTTVMLVLSGAHSTCISTLLDEELTIFRVQLAWFLSLNASPLLISSLVVHDLLVMVRGAPARPFIMDSIC